ncbi:MAG: type II toxin-antitoxin system VapC family toxin [Candidatus Tyrphobacter sp.]
MRLLLDTHCWLWLGLQPLNLGRKTRALLSDLSNEAYLSAASAWEIAIKCALGKLRLPLDPGTYVRSRMKTSRVQPLAISIEHTIAAGELAPLHRDPFDRILVAQAQLDGLTIVTADARIANYPVLVHDARR